VEDMHGAGEDMKTKTVIKKLEELSEWFDNPSRDRVGIVVRVGSIKWTAAYLLRLIIRELKEQTNPSVKI